MSPTASKNLIKGYLNISEAETVEMEKQKEHEEERFYDLTPEDITEQASITEVSVIVDPESVSMKSGIKAKDKDTDMTTPDSSLGTIERQRKERIRAEQKIENVDITVPEQQFILKIAPHLGNSPRRIKRYANTYRLM